MTYIEKSFPCPLDCNNTERFTNASYIKCFPSHIYHCKNSHLLIKGEVFLCDYDIFHIIHKEDKDSHENSCESKDFDENDMLKYIFRCEVREVIEKVKSEKGIYMMDEKEYNQYLIEKYDKMNSNIIYNRDYLEMLYNGEGEDKTEFLECIYEKVDLDI